MIADFRVFLPVTTTAHNAGLTTGIQSFQVSTIKFGQSKWSIKNYSSLRYNFLKANSKSNDILFYLAPNLNYGITPSFAASLFYGINLSHKVKDPFRWKTDRHYVGPGISWDITPSLNFSPVIAFLPENPTWRTTTMSGFLVAKIF